jgi:hypothetical protein
VTLDLEPRWVIEGSTRDSAQALQWRHKHRYGRATRRAELKTKRSIALIGLMLIGTESPARDFNVLFLEVGHKAKGAPGAPLAKRAVTDGRTCRGIGDTIAHGTAKASTFMGF